MKRLTSISIRRTRVKANTAVWIADDVEPGLRVRLSVTKSGLRRAVFFYRYRDRWISPDSRQKDFGRLSEPGCSV